MRNDLAKDFHDEMGNKLASITMLSQSIRYKMENKENDTAIESLLNSIEERSKELYYGTKDFIWSIDFKSDYIDEWFIYIRDFGEDFFGKLGISFYSNSNISQNNNLTFEATTSRQLIYVLKELMTNTAKHANANQASFEMLLDTDNMSVEIIFSDNGDGFEIEKNKLRGVKNIQERIQNIHGKLTDSSNNTNGSLYSIQLPLQHNYNL